MKRKSLGEVCRLLDLRPHVIRYWEQMIPLFEPEKNLSGRRTYGEREIHLLYRLKYLVQERKFTLEGALQALVEESEDQFANTKANIQSLRRVLLEIRESLETVETLWEKSRTRIELPGQEHVERILLRVSPQKQRLIFQGLRDISKESITLAQALLDRVRPVQPLKATILSLTEPTREEEEIPEPFEILFTQGAIGVLTFLPNSEKPLSFRWFQPLAERIRNVAYLYGRMVPWWIFGESQRIDWVKKIFQQEGFFGMDPRAILFVKEPVFPYLREGKLVILGEGEIGRYSSGVGGSLLMLKSRSFQRFIQQTGIRWFYVLPLNRFALRFPNADLLKTAVGMKLPILGTVLSNEGGFLTSGIYLIEETFLRNCDVPFSVEEVRMRIINPKGTSVDDLEEGVVRRLSSGLYRLFEQIPNPVLVQEKVHW
ncbi:MAG: MerR family transcriptional regulator [Spirochaetes bacterium]|nr:MerR family transcriptional regulator [Spirochaetota bacterium]